MTIDNCIKLLRAYEENVKKGINKDQSKKNYDNMKEHILNSKKFRGHPILEELMPKEEKNNGKKSKR